MADPKLNIFQRINKVMADLAFVRKTKKVQNYMTVTHDEVVNKVHPLLAKHGIVIVPQVVECKSAPSGMVTSNNVPISLYEATIDFVFVSIDDPNSSVTARISTHANDTGDKAPGKALSYGMKYAILKVFALETGEQEEQRMPEDAKIAPITEEQLNDLIALCEELEFPADETLQSLAEHVYQIPSIKELPGNAVDNAVKRLKRKAADAKRNAKKKEEQPAGKKPPKEKVDF
jgi:hypothetical protein